MYKTHSIKNLIYTLLFLFVLTAGVFSAKTEVLAATFPNIAVDFDPSDQSVIVSGIPAYDSTGAIHYELRGYLNYGDERIETFCYAPHAYPYHVAEKQAYVFNWADAEFLLPCSGEYKFTAYLAAVTPSSGAREEGPKTTITITLTKKDESTNWGPGLPNTTIETYDLNEIKGTDKSIRIEEEGYTWTINGNNIESVPEDNLSLAITKNPKNFPTKEVDEFGMISYSFHHASDYIIAITDTEYTGQELNSKSEEAVADSTTEQDKQTSISDKNNDNSHASNVEEQTESNTTSSLIIFLIIGAIILLVVGGIFVMNKKK